MLSSLTVLLLLPSRILVHPQLMYLDEEGVIGLVRLIAKFSGSIGAC